MNHSVKRRRQALHQTHHHYYLNISVQSANLSDCRFESNGKNRFGSENRIESKLFRPNWNARLLVRLCLPRLASQLRRAAGLLLWARRQEISIETGWRRARSTGRSTALSSKCEQCQVYNRRWRFNTDLYVMWENASNSNTSIAEYLLTAGCPAGFTYLASAKGCYSLVKDNLEWGVAGLRCKSLHPEAHLVIINDAAEQQAIKTWMSGYTGMHIRFVILYKSRMLYRANGEIREVCLRPSCTYRPIQAVEANSSRRPKFAAPPTARDEMLVVHLVKTYCLSVLLYGSETWPLSSSDN